MSDDTAKYLEGTDLSHLPAHAGAVMVAVGQFNDGKAVTEACPSCGGKISVVAKGNPPSAWMHSCQCGTCNGSLRGL